LLNAAPSKRVLLCSMESWLPTLTEFLRRACQSDDLTERLAFEAAPAELSALTDSINALLDKVWINQFQLSAKQEMLEKLVEIRTAEVHEILNNVRTGFLLSLRDETVLDNYSRACTLIFGTTDIKGKKLSELMGFSPDRASSFSLSYQQIFEDVLPVELTTAQLPKEFVLRGRSYSVEAAPIAAPDGQIVKVFFTISDNTEMRELSRQNALRQALIEIVRHKDAFVACLCETRRAFAAALASPNQVAFRSLLHTAKGNLSCFGLSEIADLIHSIEDIDDITPSHVRTVEDTLRSFLQSQRAVLGVDYDVSDDTPLQVEITRVRALLDGLVAEGSLSVGSALAKEFLERVTWRPADEWLLPLRRLFNRVLARLGKKAILTIKGEDTLVDGARLAKVFSNLGHLVRNSLDHGIEEPEQRKDKPAVGRMVIACSETAHEWHIEVSDDGRGIDTDRLCRAAVAKGFITPEVLSTMNESERIRLALLGGLSTKESATIDSGRGVGMAALLESVETEGGSIDLRSAQGRGTEIVVRVPKQARDGRRG
jgi:signal transduction histidine kinase